MDTTIAAGELFTLLGPSGCGKSTLLRIIAGFVPPTSGRVLFGDKDVTTMPPNKRDTGMVFQNYALFPHMSVAENVAYGLKARKIDKTGRGRRITDASRRSVSPGTRTAASSNSPVDSSNASPWPARS